ncbi:MAG: type I restriction endonuclease, partial [Azovibrio sp.]
MDAFNERVKKHSDHIKAVGQHCGTEETTKQALILPFLDILGFSPFDPFKVKAEYRADFPGAKSGERVDYSLFCHDVPVMFVEAKAYSEKLQNHCPQLARYFNATPEVTIAAITNGREWRFFTDLDNKNVMDKSPFLIVDFE